MLFINAFLQIHTIIITTLIHVTTKRSADYDKESFKPIGLHTLINTLHFSGVWRVCNGEPDPVQGRR